MAVFQSIMHSNAQVHIPPSRTICITLPGFLTPSPSARVRARTRARGRPRGRSHERDSRRSHTTF